MSTPAELDRLLAAGNWDAIELAGRLGKEAWAPIRRAATLPAYTSRQLAMTCAGRAGGEEAGGVLSAGLSDDNINVQLAAARALSSDPPPGVEAAVLTTLRQSSANDLRCLLALAAGYLPGERTMEVLRSLRGQPGELGDNLRMALARLDDDEAKQAILADLKAEAPGRRYAAVEQLIYVNDASLAAQVRPLLSDRAEAAPVGAVRAERYRRVCDQAVETLAQLLALEPPFELGAEKIYSDSELAKFRQLAER